MDLRERKDIVKRHPWEIVRLKALEDIIKEYIINKKTINKVLDVGCGDAFIINNLHKKFDFNMVDGVDINLTSEQLNLFSPKDKNINLFNTYDNLKDYDLILLSDVIEHVEDDKVFLSDIVTNYLVSGGYVLITVPAFEFLFGFHDVFLNHFRRYSLKKLEKLINRLEVDKISSGYLFFTLIPIRLLSVLLGIIFPVKIKPREGIGNWKGGKLLSVVIECILKLDTYILLRLSSIQIKIPGLSAWILCQKQP